MNVNREKLFNRHIALRQTPLLPRLLNYELVLRGNKKKKRNAVVVYRDEQNAFVFSDMCLTSFAVVCCFVSTYVSLLRRPQLFKTCRKPLSSVSFRRAVFNCPNMRHTNVFCSVASCFIIA